MPEDESGRLPDWVQQQALGLALAALGALMLLGLLVQPGIGAGWVLERLATWLRAFFGIGAYGVAVLTILAGLGVVLGASLARSTRGLAAFGVLFVIFLAGVHLRVPVGEEFVQGLEGGNGGAVGALVAYALRKTVGPWGAYVVLAAAGLFAASLAAESPLVEHLRAMGRAAGAGTSRVAAYVELVRKRRQQQACRGKAAPAGPPRRAPTPRSVKEPAAPPPPRKAEAAKPEPSEFLAKPGEQGPIPAVAAAVKAGKPQWKLPPLDLLSVTEDESADEAVQREIEENARRIEETLEGFGIPARVVHWERGPSVTRYELEPARGVRVSRVVNLADDLAMALATTDVRVEAPIPNRSAIGIEVPNRQVSFVPIRSVMESEQFKRCRPPLRFALGKDVAGHSIVGDLAAMPHLLIGGATNSGKSVSLNCLIVSLLYSATPEQLRLILVDPKRVELTAFEEVPHLFCPVVHDAREAAFVLREAIKEMRRRYRLFSPLGVKNIYEYNEIAPARGKEQLALIVIVVDELADLMSQGQVEFERLICRLAQLARATGIHLVVATQRPSVNVITGTIKANIASRIAFAVASQVDSRTILDANGAERLIGSGDMLYSPLEASRPLRVQGSYVTTREVQAVVEFLSSQGKPEFIIELPPEEEEGEESEEPLEDEEGNLDEYWKAAVDFVHGRRTVSVSLLQRKLRIGYNRSARLIELMEERGIVGPADGSRPREVLLEGVLDTSDWEPDGPSDDQAAALKATTAKTGVARASDDEAEEATEDDESQQADEDDQESP